MLLVLSLLKLFALGSLSCHSHYEVKRRKVKSIWYRISIFYLFLMHRLVHLYRSFPSEILGLDSCFFSFIHIFRFSYSSSILLIRFKISLVFRWHLGQTWVSKLLWFWAIFFKTTLLDRKHVEQTINTKDMTWAPF